jgi:KilA-N domain
MSAIALTISNIPVRQDDQGRFCLNDLHKAAGGESRHQPSKWIENQQTQELIAELENYDPGIPVSKKAVELVRGKGKAQGTYAVKELVYAYAMWISAKFHIAVIRAYDSLVTGTLPTQAPERKTKKALPGCLTLEQQDTIKAMVKARSERVDNAKAASVIVKTWSAIKAKFGCTYKEIPQEEYLNVISLIERLPIEGELLPKRDDMPAMTTSTEYDYNAAKSHVQQLKEIARVGLDEVLVYEFEQELQRLERCLVRAWTEMDESIHRISTAMQMLKRWRTKS